MPLSGYATEDATQTISHLYPQSYKILPSLQLHVCQIGFGAYRIDNDNDNHYKALTYALQNGINLIDTSSNYANGRSEQLIGRVLQELVKNGEIERKAIVVVSKVGYLQGDNYELAQQRKSEGRPFPNLVKYDVGLDHCIHPEFLEDQLTRTLDRLQLETVDVYLLHNPEYYLSWARRAKIDQTEAQTEYYRRIRLAFEHLEQEVANGRIRSYGVSSNTFPLPASAYTFSSLEKMWQIAESISPNHHFHVIQLPMNLYETGAATEPNVGKGNSTLAFAEQHGIGVLINRPLNAFYNDQLIRLANVLPPSYPATVDELSTMVDSLVAEEGMLNRQWLPHLSLEQNQKEQIRQSLALGQMMDGKWQGLGSYHNWHDIQAQFIVPRAQWAAQLLANADDASEPLLTWLDAYVQLFNETLVAISAFYQEMGHEKAQRMQETAVSTSSDWAAQTLSQTAVRALRSTAGVSCVLVGMRQLGYVQDMLNDLQNPVEQETRDEAWHKLKKVMK